MLFSSLVLSFSSLHNVFVCSFAVCTTFLSFFLSLTVCLYLYLRLWMCLLDERVKEREKDRQSESLSRTLALIETLWKCNTLSPSFVCVGVCVCAREGERECNAMNYTVTSWNCNSDAERWGGESTYTRTERESRVERKMSKLNNRLGLFFSPSFDKRVNETVEPHITDPLTYNCSLDPLSFMHLCLFHPARSTTSISISHSRSLHILMCLHWPLTRSLFLCVSVYIHKRMLQSVHTLSCGRKKNEREEARMHSTRNK